MMCNTLRLALLAVGLVSFSAWAQPGLGAPTVFFDRDDNTAFMTSFPNSQAKFNQFIATLNSFGVDDVDTDPVGFNPRWSSAPPASRPPPKGCLPRPPPVFKSARRRSLELDAVGFPVR